MRYRVIERIGSGGMAEVFRAVAEGPHGFERALVVKRILPRLAAAPEFVRMFVDEAKISARLSHPNIVQVFAFADVGGMPLLVMEHVEGRDLGAVLRRLAERGRAMPPAVAAEIARQCCQALDYAHRLTAADGTPLGIVHRDVTPSNIMVSWDGAVKLLDFGIARAAHQLRSTETAAGTMKGKMAYLAPELITEGAADHRADLFALGAVLHEALAGRRLFSADNDLATMKALLEMPIQPPSRINPAVSRAMDRVVMRALRRNPRERFPSAAAMAADLEGLLHRTRGAGSAVRALMDELFGEERRAGASSAASEPRGGDGTIVIDEIDFLGAGRPAAAPAPPPPPRAPAARRFLTRHRRGALVAASAGAALMALVAHGLAVRPHAGAAAAALAGPRERVEMVLDSVPQGAEVARDADGPPLGETPLVLDLPRGRAPVAVWLRKNGYEPQAFKLIPNQSHPVTVKLRPAGARAKTASLDGERD